MLFIDASAGASLFAKSIKIAESCNVGCLRLLALNDIEDLRLTDVLDHVDVSLHHAFLVVWEGLEGVDVDVALLGEEVNDTVGVHEGLFVILQLKRRETERAFADDFLKHFTVGRGVRGHLDLVEHASLGQEDHDLEAERARGLEEERGERHFAVVFCTFI